MYDYVVIKIAAQDLGMYNLIEELSLPQLEEKYPSIYSHKNLLILIRENEIIIKGSICKYYYNTNQYTLTRTTTEAAFKQLAEDLQLPIDKFQVFRFEVGTNIIVNYDIEYYLPFFCEQQNRYKYGKYNTTKYFNTQKRKISIYDKIKEVKKERIPIINEFKNKKVIRFELQYVNRLSTQFNRLILVKDLYDREFYKDVIQKWKDEYFNLYKHNQITFPSTVFTDIKNFRMQLMIWGLEKWGGESVALKMIEQEKRKGTFKYYEQKKRVVDLVKELFANPLLAEKSVGIEELDNKINVIAEEQLKEAVQ